MRAFKDNINGRWTLEGVEPSQLTYKRICNMIKYKDHFKFARYGDGEIYCMDGKSGHNCDKHQYFTDLGLALRLTLAENPPYMVGIQPLSVSHIPELVEKYTSKVSPVYDADVLHSASIDGKLDEFFNVLSERNVVLVGPQHLMSLFEGSLQVITPYKDCWLEYDSVIKALEDHLPEVEDPVVLLSCGMMAEVIIFHFRNSNYTMIDTGSVFDPFCHVYSRSYHYKLK